MLFLKFFVCLLSSFLNFSNGPVQILEKQKKYLFSIIFGNNFKVSDIFCYLRPHYFLFNLKKVILVPQEVFLSQFSPTFFISFLLTGTFDVLLLNIISTFNLVDLFGNLWLLLYDSERQFFRIKFFIHSFKKNIGYPVEILTKY